MNLQPDARERLERYLAQMRAALRGSRRVDPADVEADVVVHIQGELAAEPGPVSAQTLDSVLHRLGSPLQWVPEDERPPWRRLAARLRAGPEDWRLAYLSLALVLVALPIGGAAALVPLAVAFLVARAAVAVDGARGDEPGPQRWLLAPALVAMYAPLVVAVLLGPALAAVAAALEIDGSPAQRHLPQLALKQVETLAAVAAGRDAFETLVWTAGAAHLLLGLTGAWWIALGVAIRRRPEAPRAVLAPFAPGLRARHGVLLAGAGAVALVLAVAAYGALLLR